MAFASSKEDFESCKSIVLSWRDAAMVDGINIEGKESNLQNLLFFLHVPRSGGRSFFHCFLRKLFRYLECPCSYVEALPFDPSESSCRVVAGHHGYSITSKFPKDKTSIAAILRHPLDRVVSSYEKTVEWAAGFLVYPNSTSANQIIEKFRSEWPGVTVLDIWPWNYLLPWMADDLFARRDARGNRSIIEEIKDPYNIEDIVMPLHDFINSPHAHELIHNGATFQVAGLTNNSCLTESHQVRDCVQKHPSLGEYILDVAKERLAKMFHIALTEKHKESARMLAEVVGPEVISELQVLASQLKAANTSASSSAWFNYIEREDPSMIEEHPVVDIIPRDVLFRSQELIPDPNMTVAKLMEAYEGCASRVRKYDADRRSSSLKYVSPVAYSKEARLRVPKSIIEQIVSLNSLDIQLYKHAENIFERRQQHLMQKLVTSKKEGRSDQEDNNIYSWLSRKGISGPFTLVSLSCALFIIIARPRSVFKFKKN